VRPEFPTLRHNEAMPGKDVCKFLTTEIVFLLGLIMRLGDVQQSRTPSSPDGTEGPGCQRIDHPAK
jgi:hypothetical protein